MLVMLFSLKLHWLPAFGYGGIQSLILPVVSLALNGISTIARLTRTSMPEVIRSDYVVTATAKGLSRRRVIFVHALPNSIIPVIQSLGTSFGGCLGGAVVIENIFSRLLYGARYSLAIGLLAQVFTLFFGVLLGAVAGFFGGKVDLTVMRLLDIFEAIPAILLAIIICTALGTGFVNTVIAMGVGGIPMMSRLLRASILTVREQEYIEAAASINCSKTRQILKYVLPNSISPLIIAFTTGIGATIMQAASLSYLGLGVRPPMPEWGAMLADTRTSFQRHPHMAIFPGIAIALTVLCINIIGDALRDALDPKLKD